ncbi:MAG: response regulator transcription factor [Acidimicrobiales bacterium]
MTRAQPLTVVLADDHVLIRQGVAAVLNLISDVELVAECEDFDGLMASVEDHSPDVVVTDIRMPPTGTDEGITAARAIRAEHADVGVVVLSQFAEPEYVLQLFEDGSDRLGYLLKDKVNPEELERAIRSVSTGGSAVDGAIVEVLVGARGKKPSAIDNLTPRESEVLSCIAEGLNNAAVAEKLVLSEKAVAKHINSIFSKLDLGFEEQSHRRVKAVLLWLAQ